MGAPTAASPEAAGIDLSETLQPDGLETGTTTVDTAACPTDFAFADGLDSLLLDEIDVSAESPTTLACWPIYQNGQSSSESAPLPGNASPSIWTSDPGQNPSSSLELVLHIPRAPSPEGAQDTALRLISNWFDNVCPVWSGFDSSMNMNRKLAGDLWHSSASVFNALQSMSASFLSARTPHMRRTAMDLLHTATVCIQSEVNTLNEKARLDVFPTGPLFSLFCLGTTVCWLDAGRVGEPFLEAAKMLLQRSPRKGPTHRDQSEISSFFDKGLMYWEMLLSVVDDTDTISSTEVTAHWYPQPAPRHQREISTDMVLHPWTGISSLTSRLFTQSMRLCRTYRRRITNPTGRASSLSAAMHNVEESAKLEEQLLDLEFSCVDPINETGDCRTPWFHLAKVAEAYQMAALLQLYATFPDLVSTRLPHESQDDLEGHVPWDRWVIPLTLRLIDVLDQIPPESGSRVMQPILYICASTGLRYSSGPSANNGPRNVGTDATLHALGLDSSGIDNLLGYIGQIDETHDGAGHNPPSVQRLAVDIANGRDFIMSRLKVLETNLHPKPIIVAQELVQAIWAAYDAEPPGATAVHWLDVMQKKELRSLFG